MAEQERPEEQRTVRLASIVAVDVVGFSTTSERDQRKAARQVESLRARIEQVAAAHGGRLFNTAGDGFMCEFGSAGSALGAIQDLLDKRPKGEPPIRVGAHVGDVVVTVTNDLLGHGVNVAARLQALAAPRSALVSAEFRSMARNSPSAAFQSRGRQPLDNIEQKVQTFEILSQRQRFTRFAKRVGMGAVTVAALAGLAFVSPYVFRTVQEQLQLRTQAEASAPAPETPADVTVQEVAAITPAPNAAPTFQPGGQVFRDCDPVLNWWCCPAGFSACRIAGQRKPAARAMRDRSARSRCRPSPSPRPKITFAQWDARVAAAAATLTPRQIAAGAAPTACLIGVSWTDASVYVAWLQRANHRPGLSPAQRSRMNTPRALARARVMPSATRSLRAKPCSAYAAPVPSRRCRRMRLGFTASTATPPNGCRIATRPSYDLAPIDGGAIEAEQCANWVFRGGSTAMRLAPSASRRGEGGCGHALCPALASVSPVRYADRVMLARRAKMRLGLCAA